MIPSRRAGEERRGVHPLRQGPSRQDELRDGRCRQRDAPVDGALQRPGRHRPGERAAEGHGLSDQRGDLGTGPRRHRRQHRRPAFAKDARLRLIGVTSPRRSKYLPEIPTIAESGLPGYEFDSWFGLLGPAGVSPAYANRIDAAMAKLLRDPVILERLDKQGIEPKAMNNADFSRLLAADYERMAKMVKTSGAKLD